MSILANRIYYIDSEKRLAGTPSNFTYHLDIPDGANYDTACVLSMTIPRSYYLIRQGQNMVTLLVDGMPNVITVPKGNYNVRTFMSTLLPLLNAVLPGFTMTFNDITGKYNYTTTSTSVLAFQFIDPSRLGLQMGFDEVGTFTFASKTLDSQNVVDFVSTSTLFLHSDLVEDQTSILQEVYSDNTSPYSNLVYNCRFPGMYSKAMKIGNSGTINFSLTDEHDLEVNVNGHQILFTLLLYRKENLSKLIKDIFVQMDDQYLFFVTTLWRA
ncbi:MAG: hypothetical protein P4L81_03900 [Candidatus Pacebacteria bacterium]|nr:hypothetical protein [Candidatus Paceibacterota bacterium]